MLLFAQAISLIAKSLSRRHFYSLPLQGERVTVLALDWVTSNLYWSSNLRPHLHVTSRQGRHTALLLQGALQVEYKQPSMSPPPHLPLIF